MTVVYIWLTGLTIIVGLMVFFTIRVFNDFDEELHSQRQRINELQVPNGALREVAGLKEVVRMLVKELHNVRQEVQDSAERAGGVSGTMEGPPVDEPSEGMAERAFLAVQPEPGAQVENTWQDRWSRFLATLARRGPEGSVRSGRARGRAAGVQPTSSPVDHSRRPSGIQRLNEELGRATAELARDMERLQREFRRMR